MYQLLDYFFVIFHSALIIFNLFGWIWKKTRKANLVTLILTGLSWFALGVFYGIGFCPLTEWHWQVLTKLGERNLPVSYTEYLVNRLLGINLSVNYDILTGALFFAALGFYLFFNIRKKEIKLRDIENNR